LLSSAAVRYQPRFQQDKHLWAFICYLLLLYLYSAAVGGRHSNEFPACSNTRPLPAKADAGSNIKHCAAIGGENVIGSLY